MGGLASVQRLKSAVVEGIVAEAERAGRVIGVRLSLCDEDAEEDPWLVLVSREPQKHLIQETLPAKTKVTLANLVYVEKRDLPSPILNRLMRLAAFQNPEFYRTQAMRLSTFGKPALFVALKSFLGIWGFLEVVSNRSLNCSNRTGSRSRFVTSVFWECLSICRFMAS
jgi:hypothetical protein